MTLLEAITALVIVGLFAIGTLEALQVTSAASRSTADWTTAVAYADAKMEEAGLSSRISETRSPTAPPGFTARTEKIDRETGLEEIVVTVTMPGGSIFRLRRLATR